MNSKNKGKVGEREWAGKLRDMGFADARRGVQYSGGPDSPDVVGGIPGTHPEVKRCEALSLYRAMDQAASEAGEGEIPYVAHRRNRKPWLVVVKAEDLMEFAKRIVAQQPCKQQHLQKYRDIGERIKGGVSVVRDNYKEL